MRSGGDPGNTDGRVLQPYVLSHFTSRHPVSDAWQAPKTPKKPHAPGRNEYLFSEPVKRSGLSNVFTFVLNSGLFLRAAITRSTGRVDGVAKQGKDASATADVNSCTFQPWIL